MSRVLSRMKYLLVKGLTSEWSIQLLPLFMNWFITCIHSHIPGLKNVRYNFGYKNIKLVCGVRRNTLKILWSSTSQDDKKLRRETLQEKKGRGKAQSERKGIMELELDLLRDLTMEDKSSLSISLQNLDKGSLIFPIPELLPFLSHVDDNICEFTCDSISNKTS